MVDKIAEARGTIGCEADRVCGLPSLPLARDVGSIDLTAERVELWREKWLRVRAYRLIGCQQMMIENTDIGLRLPIRRLMT